MEERVQKILSRAGFGSRRSCEELITAGRVRVNGKLAELGMKADASKDTLTVDGNLIPKEEPKRYIALHKPRGVLSDVDPADPRPTVRDLVPVHGHLYAVGRLDLDSEGLILLTNDGELANRLTHPRYGHEKEYRVLVATKPDAEQLETWRRGVVLEDGYKTAPAVVQLEGTATKGAWLRVILREGRKRQIREVGSRIGLPVQRIIRVRIGSLLLGNLREREWRDLNADEVRQLKKTGGQEAGPRRVDPRRNLKPKWGGGGEAEGAGGRRSAPSAQKPRSDRGQRPAAGPGGSGRTRSSDRPSSGERPFGRGDGGARPAPRSSDRPGSGEQRPFGRNDGVARPAPRNPRPNRPKR